MNYSTSIYFNGLARNKRRRLIKKSLILKGMMSMLAYTFLASSVLAGIFDVNNGSIALIIVVHAALAINLFYWRVILLKKTRISIINEINARLLFEKNMLNSY